MKDVAQEIYCDEHGYSGNYLMDSLISSCLTEKQKFM